MRWSLRQFVCVYFRTPDTTRAGPLGRNCLFTYTPSKRKAIYLEGARGRGVGSEF